MQKHLAEPACRASNAVPDRRRNSRRDAKPLCARHQRPEWARSLNPTMCRPPLDAMREELSSRAKCLEAMNSATGMRTMFKAALLGAGLVASVATTAAAQVYYPDSYPGYGYYSYPGYSYPTYSYPSHSYPYGYSPYYGWPGYYQAPAYPYRAGPAYSDPYVGWRPYSAGAGPRASTHGGGY
jgi:hypothetical protein